MKRKFGCLNCDASYDEKGDLAAHVFERHPVEVRAHRQEAALYEKQRVAFDVVAKPRVEYRTFSFDDEGSRRAAVLLELSTDGWEVISAATVEGDDNEVYWYVFAKREVRG